MNEVLDLRLHAHAAPQRIIVADHAANSNAQTLLGAVRQHCEPHLGRFKRPAQVHLIDSLPRSPNGKLLRRQLRELVARPVHTASTPP